MKWSTSHHRPPHLYVDDAWYFITASVVNKERILSTHEHFNIWVRVFKGLIGEFNAKLAAWVILANHYHFLFLPHHALELGKFMKRLNGCTSKEFNTLDNAQGRTVWYSYWDTYIRGERDFWMRFNYIHYNPVKHGYVQQMEDWRFSSFHQYTGEDDKLWLVDCLRDYPVLNLVDDDVY